MIELAVRAETELRKLSRASAAFDTLFGVVRTGSGSGGPRLGLIRCGPGGDWGDLGGQRTRTVVSGVPLMVGSDVLQLTRLYGSVVIDYVKSAFGTGFVVQFASQGVC